MATSMTGLGSAEVQLKNSIITAEVKSFNNRFLEVSCRLAPSVAPFEKEIKDLIRQSIQRGKLYLSISIQGDDSEDIGLRVNAQKVRSVRQMLEDLRKTAGLAEAPTLEHYLKFSEILEPTAEQGEGGALWDSVGNAVKLALQNLQSMRDAEGAELSKDMAGRVEAVAGRVDTIEKLAGERIHETHRKMRERVQQLLQDSSLDENRLHFEIAMLADRMDVTEECVRMRSHCELFMRTLQNEKIVGKKLTFLLQEMNREVNTVCSKSNQSEISHIAVEMKEEIEKLREQVQNLE
jgi:uncharacterized protein (TIGR00255 family)